MQSSGDPTATPGLRERKRLATRQALEAAALDLALTHGVAGITVDQVAERADVSRRTFFNYFASLSDALLGRSKIDASIDLVALLRSKPRGAGVFLDLENLVLTLAESTLFGGELYRRRVMLLLANPDLAAEHLVSTATLLESIIDEVSLRVAEERGENRSLHSDRLARMLIHLCAAALHHGLEEYRRDPAGPDPAHTVRAAFATIHELKEHHL